MTKFEGSVQWVGGDAFGAQLIDVDTLEEISADVYLHLVRPEDRDKLTPGALFFWTPGSMIEFREMEDDHDSA